MQTVTAIAATPEQNKEKEGDKPFFFYNFGLVEVIQMPYGYGFAYLLGAQILFFIVTIGLIIWFVKSTGRKDIYPLKDILDRRLVSGEIKTKEYNILLKTITYLGD